MGPSEHWPGTSVHQFLLLKQPDQFTDASESWGCGTWSAPHWFQIHWTSEWAPQTIAFKELLPIMVAVAIWSNTDRGRGSLCHCGNAVVVLYINRLHARDPQASHMLCYLAYLQAMYNCRLRVIQEGAARIQLPITTAMMHRIKSALAQEPCRTVHFGQLAA